MLGRRITSADERALNEGPPVDTLLGRLRQRGWRLTPQRRVVAEVLRGDHVHLTAEEVHRQARARLPEVSLATVYNTLNELVAMGEVQAVTVSGGPRRYDPNVTSPHQHLVCESCGELRDVQPDNLDDLQLTAGQRHGFDVQAVDVLFRGRCPTCQD